MSNSEGVKYSKKVDIWALGIILYHTVYEVLPFTSVPGGKNGKIKAIASIDDPVDFPSIDNIDPMLLVSKISHVLKFFKGSKSSYSGHTKEVFAEGSK